MRHMKTVGPHRVCISSTAPTCDKTAEQCSCSCHARMVLIQNPDIQCPCQRTRNASSGDRPVRLVAPTTSCCRPCAATYVGPSRLGALSGKAAAPGAMSTVNPCASSIGNRVPAAPENLQSRRWGTCLLWIRRWITAVHPSLRWKTVISGFVTTWQRLHGRHNGGTAQAKLRREACAVVAAIALTPTQAQVLSRSSRSASAQEAHWSHGWSPLLPRLPQSPEIKPTRS